MIFKNFMKKKKNSKKIQSTACFLAFVATMSALSATACKTKQDIDASFPPATEGSASQETPSPEAPPIEPIEPIEPTPQPTPDPEPTPVEPVKTYAKYIRCTGNNVNLRAGAGTNYTVLGQAAKGTQYTVLEEKNGWYKTYYRNDTAYLHASYATVFSIEKSEDKIEAVIEEGYKLLGVPYVYGAVRLHDGKGNFLKGFSVQKFDCSSLIQYIFYQGAKVLLDVTTRTQVTQGKAVKKSNLQRGDCIYFTNEERQYKTGIERVGHVALYLGDNYILHTSSDYARIEQISSRRWSFYIEARRFV